MSRVGDPWRALVAIALVLLLVVTLNPWVGPTQGGMRSSSGPLSPSAIAARAVQAAEASLREGGPAGTSRPATGGGPGGWRNLTSGLATSPAGRRSAAIAYDAVSQYVVLFGGYYQGTFFGDTWAYKSGAWTELWAPTSSPGTCQPPAGGTSVSCPSPRGLAGMTYDAKDGYVLLFGGVGTGGYLSDTWSFQLGKWSQIAPSTPPSARELPAMTYDAEDQYVVLFGGDDGAGSAAVLDDTYKFAGGQWTQLAPTQSPPPLTAVTMANDPSYGYVVLYGGCEQNTCPAPSYNVTWRFLAGEWSRLTLANGPLGRGFASLVYDSMDNYLLLFGGENASDATVYSDTWLFEAGNWTKLAPAVSPSARWGAAAVADVTDGYVLLFGGAEPNAYPDTWEYEDHPYATVPAANLSSADVGQSVRFSTVAGGGTGSYPTYAWAEDLSTLGCTFANAPSITCVPNTPSIFYHVSVNVTDSIGVTSATNNSAPFDVVADPLAAVPTPTPSTVDVGETVVFATSGSQGTGTYVGYNWSVAPAGLGCATSTTHTATLSCVPTAPGTTYRVSATVTDSNGFISPPATSAAFTVLSAPAVSVPTANRSSADLGQSVAFSTTASGGTGTYPDYTWTASSALLQCTLANAPSISCLPAAPATNYKVSVVVNDSSGAVSAPATSAPFPVFSDPLAATPVPSRQNTVVGQPVSFTTTPSGGDGTYLTYTWTASSPGLGCVLANTVAITCTPVAPGSSYTVSVSVTDSNRVTSPVSTSALFTVLAGPSVQTPVANRSTADVGQPVLFSTSASGGSGSYTSYAWSSSSVGIGCTFGNGSSITCLPTAPGTTYTVSVTVTDSLGRTSAPSTSAAFTVFTDPKASAPLPNATLGQVGTPVVFSTTATGGTGTYSVYAWVESSTGLGCTLASSATITCLPTSTGSLYTVSVRVSDSNGALSPVSTSSTFSVLGQGAGGNGPVLLSVTLSPTNVTLDEGASLVLTALPGCSAGACPGGIVYVWSLSQDLGTLNTTSGPVVRLTAGSSAGTLGVTVRATLGSTTLLARSSITVGAATRPGSGPFGLGSSSLLLFLLEIVAILLLLGAIAYALWGWNRRPSRSRNGGEATASGTGGAVPPPPSGYYSGVTWSKPRSEWSGDPQGIYGVYPVNPTQNHDDLPAPMGEGKAPPPVPSAPEEGEGPGPTPWSMQVSPEGIWVGKAPSPQEEASSRVPEDEVTSDTEESEVTDASQVPTAQAIPGPSPSLAPEHVYALLQALRRRPHSIDGIKQTVRLDDAWLLGLVSALLQSKLIVSGTNRETGQSVYALTPIGRKFAQRSFGQAKEGGRSGKSGEGPQALPASPVGGSGQKAPPPPLDLGKGARIQDAHRIGRERATTEEQSPFEGLRPEDVNPQLKGKKALPKEVLQPMEMRVSQDRGTDTRDASSNPDSEARTRDLLIAARKAREARARKDKFGVQQSERPAQGSGGEREDP